MKIPRFIVSVEAKAAEAWISDGEIVHRIKDVLRLAPGREVILSDGRGHELRGVISALEPQRVGVTIEHTTARVLPLARQVTLYAAIIKHKHFDMVVEKATEVGVVDIVPVIAERTVKLGVARARLEKIIVEASEQCGRAMLPTLGEPLNFFVALEEARKKYDVVWLVDFCKQQFKPVDIPAPVNRVAIFIGPEGGWSKQERAAAEQAECLIRSLGSLTLRAETAAIIASYLATSS